MNLNKTCYYFLVSAFLFIAAACAKVNSPTGGLRDRKPPVVEESIPVNGTTNFKGKKVEITFDEYVVLDNINDKFMVSPPMKKKPRVFIRGKNLNVEYDEALKDSSTYTFYFLDAIRDLNESNILDNYKFVFSTGNVIDSLSVTGNVYNALNLEAPEKTIVLLYRDHSDSAVMKDLPDYLSRVDQTGYFRTDNMREGTYRLYALKDDDNSKNYNRIEEQFAFLDTLITVTSEKNFIPPVKDTIKVAEAGKNTKTAPVTAKTAGSGAAKIPELPALKGKHELILFAALKKDHYLIKSDRSPRHKLVYILSLPPDSMKFDFTIPDTGNDKYFIEKTRAGDTITVWLTDSSLYASPLISTIIKYPFTDTLGVLDYKEDTIPMRFLAPKAPRVAKKTRPKLVVENNILGGLKPGQKIVFTAQTPLHEPDTSRIRLYEMIEKSRKKMPYRFTRDSNNSGKVTFEASLAEGKQYLLIADSAAFSNIYNEVSDSTGIKFNVRNTDSFSKISLNITNSGGNCIIQLLNNTDKLMAEKYIKGDGKIEFPLLEKGVYRLRAIFDLDGNGKWTTGDFMTHRQPEPVTYYGSELDLKEGWTADQSWDLKDRNFKDQKLRQKPKTR